MNSGQDKKMLTAISKRVFICSPYRGDVSENIERAKQYCRFAALTGSIPFAPHLLYTQFLDDTIEYERMGGIHCGLNFLTACKELWIFGVNGISEGMRMEITEANRLGIETRRMDRVFAAWKKGREGDDGANGI